MKKIALTLSAILMFSCTSCSSIDNTLKNVLLEKSKIQEDEDYQQYESLLTEGELNDSGYYRDYDFSVSDTLVPDGIIHVTFAKNPYLNVVYCGDEFGTKRIETDSYYLNPGDTIYYAECDVKNPTTDQYVLKGFRVYGYDTDGTRYEESVCESDNEENNIVCKVPLGYTGTELSIVPIGQYVKRPLTLSVYMRDDTGNVIPQFGVGQWSIDGKEVDSESVSVDPVENYTVQYKYENDYYFFVSSSPKAYYSDDGMIIFPESSALEGLADYSVELHNYLDIKITSDEKGKILYLPYNDTSISTEDLKKEQEKKIKNWPQNDVKLKYGDKILVETTGELIIDGEDADHVAQAKASLGSGITRYTLTLQQDYTSDSGIIHVTLDTDDKYGTCEFKYGRDIVSGYTDVRVGDSVKLTYKLTDDTYTFADDASFLKNLFQQNTRSVDITITEDMADSTLKREDYIPIIRKES